MTLKAKTGGRDDLKAIVSAISTLVEEATFVGTTEGITFRGMDPSHVALIDISCPNYAFERYECDAETRFGVRVNEFDKLIKEAKKNDSIEISISEQRMMEVAIGRNKKYKMRLIEPSATDTPLPDIPYDAKITMAWSRFKKILDDVQVVSDYLTIHTSGSKVEFTGKGDSGEVVVDIDMAEKGAKDGSGTTSDTDTKGVEKDPGTEDEIDRYEKDVEEISSKKDSTGTYDLGYIKQFVNAIGAGGGSITCEFSDVKPLRIEFKLANIGRIYFYLAPRTES